MICEMQGCGRTARENGRCWYHRGDMSITKPPCSIDGCDAISLNRGLCSHHLYRDRRIAKGLAVFPDRWQDRIVIDPDTGCWNCTSGRDGDGYPKLKGIQASRFVWQEMVGPIPEGAVLDHIVCRNRACVNPEHLRVVTPRVNTLENSEGPAAKNAAKTHCVHGHDFTAENTYITPEGRRQCRICRAARNRLSQSRRR
jgi:hypothetical protein